MCPGLIWCTQKSQDARIKKTYKLILQLTTWLIDVVEIRMSFTCLCVCMCLCVLSKPLTGGHLPPPKKKKKKKRQNKASDKARRTSHILLLSRLSSFSIPYSCHISFLPPSLPPPLPHSHGAVVVVLTADPAVPLTKGCFFSPVRISSAVL